MTDSAPAGGRLDLLLDALGAAETDAVTLELIRAFGGGPATVVDRQVGEPGYRSRRLTFPTGGEIILHDDAIAAVLLHVVPTPTTPRAIDLSSWIPVVGDGSTLDDLAAAFGSRPSFVGFGRPFFALDGGFARAVFRDDRGWKERGNLLGLVVEDAKPGLTTRPEDAGCPVCAEVLVRRPDGLDETATVAGLVDAVAAGRFTEDAHWVRIADLLPLRDAGSMDRAESQLTCTSCRRILCLAFPRDGALEVDYCALDEARRHRMDAIPPVEEWGDEARIAQELAAMHYVDHEPGMWFLVEQEGVLYLQARYSWSAIIDDSALIRLDDAELESYRAGGHAYLTDLARSVHDSAPYREESRFYDRNLYRGKDDRRWRDAVGAAIVNHTWIAQQRR